MLTAEEMTAWGWRIPFLFGLLLGGAGFILRRSLPSEPPPAAETQNSLPLVTAVRDHGWTMLKVAALCIVIAVGFYIGFVYITTYLQEYDGLDSRSALDITTASMVVLVVLLPLFALLSDRFGRKPVMAAGIVGVAVSAYPCFLLLHSGDATLALLGEVIFAVFVALTCVSLPPIMAESFPRSVRVTAVSVAYNTPFAIAGGTAPLVAEFLIGESGNPFAPAYYIVAAALVSLTALLTIRETRWRPIPE